MAAVVKEDPMSLRIVRSFVLALCITTLAAPALTAAPLPPSPSSGPFRLYLPLVNGTGALPAVSLTQIGAPIWRPVDLHLFSAPIGTAPDYAGFGATIAELLPPPNHLGLGGGPGAPHAPPYNTELAQGVTSQGFHEGQRFTVSEFSSGNGVYIVWTMLPDPGTTGSSHDFSSGPIIPRSLFPIHLEGVTYQNDAVFDPALYTTDLQPTDTTTDGPSHFAIFIADNTDFGPSGANPVGSYEYRITLTDLQGNGWSIVARFWVS
jgi:hypothetical protein